MKKFKKFLFIVAIFVVYFFCKKEGYIDKAKEFLTETFDNKDNRDQKNEEVEDNNLKVIVADEDEKTNDNSINDSETYDIEDIEGKEKPLVKMPTISYLDISEYNNEPFVVLNNNKPFFTGEEITYAKKYTYEYYETLDGLNRALYGQSSIDRSIMPKKGEKRGSISNVKPTGWKSKRYDFIDNGGWLYNRCHLLGYQLTGENANPRNLITGTREFNAKSMLPFENMVADYLKEDKDRKVLYRVTAIYNGDELVARGVVMEALGLSDSDLSYCVFIYNVQDGIEINYKNGNSKVKK